MQRIVYTDPETGNLAVIVPVTSPPDPPGMTEDELVERAIGHVPEGIAYRVVDEADVPTDRTFRNAWTDDGKTIVHDMVRAREIWKDKMRAARAPILASLDVQYMKADEAGDATAKKTVAAQKQALRDAPEDPAIAAAQTVDDLKKVWPSALG